MNEKRIQISFPGGFLQYSRGRYILVKYAKFSLDSRKCQGFPTETKLHCVCANKQEVFALQKLLSKTVIPKK